MRLKQLAFDDLAGWGAAEAARVWPAFMASCAAVVEQRPALRSGLAPSAPLIEACAEAMQLESDGCGKAEAFFRRRFRPFEVLPADETGFGFLTGYYEPQVTGSLSPGPGFTTPILARPPDLINMREIDAPGWDRRLEGARRNAQGALEPYPDRATIEAGGLGALAQPVVWLRDAVEVFFIQVQGSARVLLPDGRQMRLVYAGRNGRPYSSIGKALIEAGEIPADEMSLARCKQWLRANGLDIGQPGRAVLQRNLSYVFFRLDPAPDPAAGPVGAQGVRLSALRSVAVDRAVWPYATPVWIDGDFSNAGLGVGRTGRLMIAQDTGSAIVGPARGDLFIGTGDEAGRIAGNIRHSARFIVLLPTNELAP